eukprot:712980-Hanusia_phi.AAC.1
MQIGADGIAREVATVLAWLMREMLDKKTRAGGGAYESRGRGREGGDMGSGVGGGEVLTKRLQPCCWVFASRMPRQPSVAHSSPHNSTRRLDLHVCRDLLRALAVSASHSTVLSSSSNLTAQSADTLRPSRPTPAIALPPLLLLHAPT